MGVGKLDQLQKGNRAKPRRKPGRTYTYTKTKEEREGEIKRRRASKRL